jgi:hypothetical protein
MAIPDTAPAAPDVRDGPSMAQRVSTDVPDADERFMAQVASITAAHVAGADGTCVGCQNHWHRWVSHPCTQAKWATAAQARFGSCVSGKARSPGNQELRDDIDDLHIRERLA